MDSCSTHFPFTQAILPFLSISLPFHFDLKCKNEPISKVKVKWAVFEVKGKHF